MNAVNRGSDIVIFRLMSYFFLTNTLSGIYCI